MATWTVQPSGGDYTSLNAALSNASTVANDIIEISGDWTSASDTAESTVEDDNITIRTAASDQARHAGFYNGTTNWELNTSGNNHSLTINNTGCILDGLVIVQSGTGNSDEVVRIDVDSTTTVVDTILRCANVATDQDCLYCGSFTSTINCENVIVIGAGRAGFNAQLSSSGAADTQTWNLISCTAWNNGRNSGEADGGGVNAHARNASSVANINCFNCLFVGNTSSNSEDYQNATGTNSGTRVWSIDNCGEDSTRTTITTLDSGAVSPISFETVTDGVLGAANDQVGFQDITTAPYDLRLQDDANNDAQDVHTNSTGSGLTFGDYVGSSVDIAGTTRPVNTNYDLGAFEVEGAADVSILPPAANLQLSTTAPVRLLETFRIPPAAQLQLSTAAPTISFSLSIQPPAANLALSTTAPIVAVTENVSIEVPAAQLQLSATAPTIETPIGIEVPAAQLQISTATPAILFGFTISPPAAQLALSTATPIVAAGANVSITIPAAQLEISTTAPEIETPVGITIPAAQLQLSTTAPTINQGFSIEIPAANLELSTTAPDIETPVGIEVPAANLEISTTAPSVLVFGGDVAIEIPAAQLVLSTTAPTVQAGANISIEIPAAQLEISTSVADLVLDLIRQPDAAQIQITTAAPSLIVTSNIEIEPPAAQLTLSTAAPTFDVAGPVSLEIPAAQLALSTFQPLVNVSLPSTVGKATVYCYLLLENGDLLQFEDTTQPGRLLLEDSIVSPITDSLTMNLPVDLILFDPVEVDEKPK